MASQNQAKCPGTHTAYLLPSVSAGASSSTSQTRSAQVVTLLKEGMLSPKYKELRNVGMSRWMGRNGYKLWFTLSKGEKWISFDGMTPGIFNLRNISRR